MKNVLLIGCGEVGEAIHRIEIKAGNSVSIITQSSSEAHMSSVGRDFDVMHVNIPFSDKFAYIVTEYVKRYSPKLVIINSTVKLGTTRALKAEINIPVVHSPIRGIHPNLYEGIKTFVKYIGGDEEDSILAEDHFKEIGIKTHICLNAETTEIGKILSTTYYGWNILFAKQAKLICENAGADFDDSYTDFNKTYNDGYIELDKPEVVRPILKPPKIKIGGHCISQNFELLPESKLKKISKDLNEN